MPYLSSLFFLIAKGSTVTTLMSISVKSQCLTIGSMVPLLSLSEMISGRLLLKNDSNAKEKKKEVISRQALKRPPSFI